MEKYEQLLNMLMDFNESVRFAAVSDSSGNLLWNSQRDGVSNIVPIEKTKATMSRSRGEWDDYASSAEIIGDGMYSITCLLYTSPSPRDATLSRMPSSA